MTKGALISFSNSSTLAAQSTFVHLSRSQIVYLDESTKPCPPTQPDDTLLCLHGGKCHISVQNIVQSTHNKNQHRWRIYLAMLGNVLVRTTNLAALLNHPKGRIPRHAIWPNLCLS